MTSANDWIDSVLPQAARHPGLALARLSDARIHGKMGLTLTSPAFAPGEALDPCFTADEEDAVAPPLEWTSPPPGAQEIAIIVEDATSTGPEPRCHWMVWGLPGQRGKLLEGETPPRTGKNAIGNSEWLLPDLPDDETHTYVFQLFALDLPLTLLPGASRSELLAALDGHVMASTSLVAQYTKSEENDDWVDDEID